LETFEVFNRMILCEVRKNKRSWIVNGLIFGAIMYVIMCIAYPLVMGIEITSRSLLSGLIVYGIGGLLYGILEKIMLSGLKNGQKD